MVHLPSEVARRAWWPKGIEFADGAYLPVPELGYSALTDEDADDDADDDVEAFGESRSIGVYYGDCPGPTTTALSAAFWADE